MVPIGLGSGLVLPSPPTNPGLGFRGKENPRIPWGMEEREDSHSLFALPTSGLLKTPPTGELRALQGTTQQSVNAEVLWNED